MVHYVRRQLLLASCSFDACNSRSLRFVPKLASGCSLLANCKCREQQSAFIGAPFSTSGTSITNQTSIQTYKNNNETRLYDSQPKPELRWAKFPDGSRFWKPQNGKVQRPIFVAATRQHVGKTTCSLAIVSGLKKRFEKVGFIKPVGQQHVEVVSDNKNATIRVDKDVCLMREHFHLNHIDYEDMSPVIIPSGYTKKFVDGEITLNSQINDVEVAMEKVTVASDVVVLEGTGHCAVGSIVGLNNAKVASLLGADMVLICNGGLGSAFDELELNRVLCQHYNVRIAGVILNKVRPDKLEQTEHYMRKAMLQAWGVPLLACIPDQPYLGCPALADMENLFQTKLISGQEHRFRHYSVNDINVVTTSLTRFLENLREKPSRTLYLCHVTRDDLIVGFLGDVQRRRETSEQPFEAALIICGRKTKYQLSPEGMKCFLFVLLIKDIALNMDLAIFFS
jgi:dethiobiotin synthetase